MLPLPDERTQHSGQTFEDMTLSQQEIISEEFDDCLFVRCSFVEAVFSHCRFSHCLFQHCDLTLVRLPDSLFTDTAFEDSKLIGVDWTPASWPKARLSSPIAFSRCVINHSTFTGLDVHGITIRECMAKNVDLTGANLTQADLTRTDFHGSLFVHTDLTEADLTRAKNYHINASLNVLKRTRFSVPEAMSLLAALDIILVE
jgi:fluoroquinolone resistance protein